MFNFREIMSKMREFVYFETIFVNSATPPWANANNEKPRQPLCGWSAGLSVCYLFRLTAVSDAAVAAKIDKLVNRSID